MNKIQRGSNEMAMIIGKGKNFFNNDNSGEFVLPSPSIYSLVAIYFFRTLICVLVVTNV